MATHIRNIRQILTPVSPGNTPLLKIENGTVIVDESGIIYVGGTAGAPVPQNSDLVIDGTGQILTPGLIDCHTHLVFAGDRSGEFIRRTQGTTYSEIAASGGGILSTVQKTRDMSENDLLRNARIRAARWLSQGVTSLEIKSGYGLSVESELKLLRVINRLKQEFPGTVQATFMGAHEIPPEYRDDRSGWISVLTQELLPEIARNQLAEACDVFCETGVYSLEESEKIARAALQNGLKIKFHADELTPLGGASLAARLQALSADHLLCITDDGIRDLAASETVGVLLPGTAWYLKMPYAPARKLINSGATVALATDFNPGSCTLDQFSFIWMLAALYMSMSPDEILSAVTLNAAKAVGIHHITGKIEPGFRGDLVLWNSPSLEHLIYHPSLNHAGKVFASGQLVWQSEQWNECLFI
ncbi:MAG: imidazolonepropionase [Bacteroidetes bacterium]|nr:imidazolonepropionase [Bacteroidota bacterium]